MEPKETLASFVMIENYESVEIMLKSLLGEASTLISEQDARIKEVFAKMHSMQQKVEDMERELETCHSNVARLSDENALLRKELGDLAAKTARSANLSVRMGLPGPFLPTRHPLIVAPIPKNLASAKLPEIVHSKHSRARFRPRKY
jgi:cell division protein FtsB